MPLRRARPPHLEAAYPTNARPRMAIEAKRKWLRGEISRAALDSLDAATRRPELAVRYRSRTPRAAAAWAAAAASSWAVSVGGGAQVVAAAAAASASAAMWEVIGVGAEVEPGMEIELRRWQFLTALRLLAEDTR